MERKPTKPQPAKPELETVRKNVESLAKAYRKLAPYLNLGYVWAASVILFTAVGWYLDKKWHSSPWLTLVGAVLGVATGFYQFFKTVMNLEKKKSPKK